MEWGPWIEHDGNGCPCVGQYVQYEIGRAECGADPAIHMHLPGSHEKHVGGCIYEAFAVNDGGWRWARDAYPNIRYRIRKPRGLTILEALIADLPAPVAPKVDA